LLFVIFKIWEVKEIMYPIFEGEVVHGLKMGTLLGFPTANVETTSENIPQDGVYIVQIAIGELRYYGIMSIGNRPTFEATVRTIEVHFLNFSGNLYQQLLKIKPLLFIRGNKKHESVEQLIAQLKADSEMAQKYIQNL